MCLSEPVLFHPQISRNLHPWIHPCVLSCWHLSVTHEPRFRFVWVQKWPFDLRVSICSLHLRLWSGSVWRFWSRSGRSIWGCPCVYWGHVSACLPYVTGFAFKPKILSCDKENLCDTSKTEAYHNRASHFIKQIISSSTLKELYKMPQQLPHSPKLISPLCYGNTGVFQLWRHHWERSFSLSNSLT